jgi:hypothetical protein
MLPTQTPSDGKSSHCLSARWAKKHHENGTGYIKCLQTIETNVCLENTQGILLPEPDSCICVFLHLQMHSYQKDDCNTDVFHV